MDSIECIKTRMSIRKFIDQEVPRKVIEQAFDAARWSPSYKNSQPWEVVVVSGERKKALSTLLLDLYDQGTPESPDLEEPAQWPTAEDRRIAHLYRMRAEATGMDLRDPKVIAMAKKANFRFYGAPHVVYLFQEKALSLWSLFDIGLFAQSFMLAAHDLGLGTVPQAFVTDYAAQVKEFLGISEDRRLILGISLGYPDMDAPANRLRTDRMDVAEFVSWER